MDLDATTEPHCGVCQHADWEELDRAPHCSEWEQSTKIRLGKVCTAFDVEADVDAPIEEPDERIDRPEEATESHEEREIGCDGPFYAVYFEDGGRQYGWFCANCRTLDVAMDPMGRMECTNCGNSCKPSEWDAAYM